jgi:hypothetical protein
MAATVTLEPDCGPAFPQSFAVFMDVSSFPPNTFLSFELLRSDGSRVFLGGGTTDASGSGYPSGGLEGFFGMQQPSDVYTLHVFVDTDEDGVPDPGGEEGSATILVPCCTITGLAGLVVGFHLQPGIATSLNSKLAAARRAADAGRLQTACHEIDAFLAEVQAQNGKQIAADQGQQLMAAAGRLVNCLGCP